MLLSFAGEDAAGLSWKRTVLDAPLEGVRKDVLGGRAALPESEPVGLVEAAWAKSAASAGSLGCVSVDELAGLLKPWNCEVRSSSCFFSAGSESAIRSALL